MFGIKDGGKIEKATETVMYYHQNSLEIIACTNILSGNSFSPRLSYSDLCRHVTLPAKTIVQTNTLPPSTVSKELEKKASGLGTQE